MMHRVLLVFLVVIGCQSVLQGANRFSRSNGTWSATNGGPDCGCVPGQNDDIFVNHDISLAGPFTVNTGSLTVNSPATLTVNGNLTFNNNSTVVINLGATLQVNGNFENKNNSDEIDFNGAIGITGNFTNGTGGSGSAIIDFGPGATISIGGTCSNAGQVNDGSGSYSGCGQGVLPVKLIYFYVEVVDGTAQANWATSSEEDFEKFIVERSSTGLNFLPIGEVNGVGRNIYDIESRYAFEDESPLLGYNYYRLKAVDLDGAFEYFDVRVIKISGQKNLAVYPNPSSGGLISFRLNFNPGEDDQIVMLNSLGVELSRSSVNAIENHLELGAGLTPGVYILQYFSSDFKVTQRVFVTK